MGVSRCSRDVSARSFVTLSNGPLFEKVISADQVHVPRDQKVSTVVSQGEETTTKCLFVNYGQLFARGEPRLLLHQAAFMQLAMCKILVHETYGDVHETNAFY